MYVEATLKLAEWNGTPAEDVAQRIAVFRAQGIDAYRREELRALLKQRDRDAPVSPVAIARLYHALGEKQQALDWLERGVEERTFQVLFLKTYPGWTGLRGETRFQELLRKMRLD